jgi:anti-sigma factor RsiW
MAFDDSHVSDQDLLLAVDGELSKRRTAEIEAHLASCQECRGRQLKMSAVIAHFIQIYHGLETHLHASAGPRALLRARLAELAQQPGHHRWFGRIWIGLKLNRLAYIGSAAVVLALLALVAFSGRPARDSAPWFAQRGKAFLPDRNLTPGAVVELSMQELCSGEDLDRLHTVSYSLARKTFELYGIRRPEPRAYEVDYLITPALGGADDVRNLWPQPYSAGVWNSRHKDALEDRLRQLVCEAHLPLAVAQHDIALDWIAAYKKHFQTEVPIAEHFAFVKDRPWED